MAHINKVIKSVKLDGELVCTDVFQRPDGTYGFDEFRRDPEDGRGWYSIGHYGGQAYKDAKSAIAAVRAQIHWLEDKLA